MLQAAGNIDSFAFGPRAGQKEPAPGGGMPRTSESCHVLCADIDGRSLRTAAVRCEDTDRKHPEQLCHHRTRAPLSDEHCSAKPWGRWCLSSRHPGATAARSW